MSPLKPLIRLSLLFLLTGALFILTLPTASHAAQKNTSVTKVFEEMSELKSRSSFYEMYALLCGHVSAGSSDPVVLALAFQSILGENQDFYDFVFTPGLEPVAVPSPFVHTIVLTSVEITQRYLRCADLPDDFTKTFENAALQSDLFVKTWDLPEFKRLLNLFCETLSILQAKPELDVKITVTHQFEKTFGLSACHQIDSP